MKILVTGGAGFIGSAVIRRIMTQTKHEVVNVDKLTYAGNLDSLAAVANMSRYFFEQVDICDKAAVEKVFAKQQPDSVLHLAAESHVDRSIDGPAEFINTNIFGTYTLLEVARAYFSDLSADKKSKFRFHHVSTDEVFGSLGVKGLFTEETSYQPNSPYSASKASSDHLVRAWHHTFKLPILTTNCSNNYGPYQFPEKLIPLIILNAIEEKPLPVYGKGENIRDWLFVDDHADALLTVHENGSIGETYNIGGNNEIKNIEVVQAICDLVDELKPTPGKSRRDLIKFVTDRPGHDMRYAIDARKIEDQLNWVPSENFKSGLKKTVEWYLENKNSWCQRVQDGSYRRERLGLTENT